MRESGDVGGFHLQKVPIIVDIIDIVCSRHKLVVLLTYGLLDPFLTYWKTISKHERISS